MDRRAFLNRSGTAILTASALGNLTFGSNENVSAQYWVLLADTHLPDDETIRHGQPAINPVEQFRRVRKDILNYFDQAETAPQGIITCGDCAFLKGRKKDYFRIKEEYAPFGEKGWPAHFVLGNHDNRSAFLDVLNQHTESVPERYYAVLETAYADFYLLDSLTVTNRTQGLLGEEQLLWLAAQLDKRPTRPAILFAHHYPDYSGPIISNPHALQDTKRLYEVMDSRKQVKSFIFGHAHIWKTLKRKGIHLVNLPTTAWRFEPGQPAGWVLMQLHETGMQLTLRSLDPTHRHHNQSLLFNWR